MIPASATRRWAWFIGLYLASLAVFALSTGLLRWLLRLAADSARPTP